MVTVLESLDSPPKPAQLVRQPPKHRNVRYGRDLLNEKPVLHHLVPTYPDDTPIQWDDNDASLGGVIADIGEFFERTGICTEIFETGSVTQRR